ncbi:bifunctional DNA primase/polymerase [Microbacterium sp. NPDC078849]|uniref:bifunctional DNA primase/polymerase n=1 Tax=unclassified Microbacterium TaxID=2609290 RepID=UPI00344C5C08
MRNRDIALANAANGWPVFPVQADKTPEPGFMNWERQATGNPSGIRRFWEQYPDALPAIAPGVVHRAVIDVDLKPGKPNGYESLALHGIDLDAIGVPGFPSLSGLGTHYWFAGRFTSINHILPGVDRKSRGGYVVAPYLLPPVRSVAFPPPALLAGSKVGTTTADEARYLGNASTWFAERAGRAVTPAVARAVKPFIAGEAFTGHEAMLRWQIHLVKLATEGHGGVPEALGFGRDVWLESPHTPGEDPAREWDVALDRAITKYGGTTR